MLLLFIGGIKTAKTYGLISDIHANHISLQVALEDINQLGVDEILCAGDIVGYGGAPNEVVRLLRKYKVKCIMGNHDLFFAVEMKENVEMNWPLVSDFKIIKKKMKFRDIGQIMIKWQIKKMKPLYRRWLGSLPLSYFSEEKDLYMVHGAPPLSVRFGQRMSFSDYYYATMKYLFPWKTEELAIAGKIQPAPTMVVGHSHMQFANQSRYVKSLPIKTAHPCLMKYHNFPVSENFNGIDPVLINPGSIGQSRDEVEAPGYSVLTLSKNNNREITWYRYYYDYDEYTSYLRKHNAPEKIISKEFWKYSENTS